MIENQHRWFLRKDERKLVSFIKNGKCCQADFRDRLLASRRGDFQAQGRRETTTYWGWLPPAKSYDFVPASQLENLRPLLHR